MRTLPLVSPLALLLLAACGGGVTVRPTGFAAAAKPRTCELEVLQKAPDRPYDALADLESHVTNVPPEGALSVVTPKACELGADAVIVVRNMVLNEFGHTLVAVTAIKYRLLLPPSTTGVAPAPEPEPPAPEPSQPATSQPAPAEATR
jgi:hypothetical protein